MKNMKIMFFKAPEGPLEDALKYLFGVSNGWNRLKHTPRDGVAYVWNLDLIFFLYSSDQKCQKFKLIH